MAETNFFFSIALIGKKPRKKKIIHPELGNIKFYRRRKKIRKQWKNGCIFFLMQKYFVPLVEIPNVFIKFFKEKMKL